MFKIEPLASTELSLRTDYYLALFSLEPRVLEKNEDRKEVPLSGAF